MTIVKIYIGMSLELLRAVVVGGWTVQFQIVYCSSLYFSRSMLLLLLLLSHFSHVQLCATPQMAAHQAPPTLGFFRQEYRSGLSFPSPMHACMLNHFSRFRLSATPCTGDYQAPLSTGFPRQEYWSGLPPPSPVKVYRPLPTQLVLTTGFHLLYLSLPKWFPLFFFFGFCGSQVSSLSNFPLDTKGRRWSLIQAHLFSHAVRREKHCKQISLVCVGSTHSVWATLGLPPLTECVLSWSSLLRLQVALQRNCLKRAMGSVHFPGLSCSCSGSRVLHKGADSVGPSFVPFPGPSISGDQVLGELSPGGVVHLTTSPIPDAGFSAGVPSQVCRVGRDFFFPLFGKILEINLATQL